jgi:hypothetical protein
MLRAATVGIRLIDVNPSDHSDSARPADIHFWRAAAKSPSLKTQATNNFQFPSFNLRLRV